MHYNNPCCLTLCTAASPYPLLQSYDASKDGYYRVSDAKQDSYATYKFKEPGTYW